jgi:hypothetical protein
VDPDPLAVDAAGRPRQGHEEQAPKGPRVEFKDIAAALPAALAVGAAAVYGILLVAYSQFSG